MNKFFGLMAAILVVSIVAMGCSQPAEGDTATQPTTKPDAGTSSTPAPDGAPK